MNFNSNFNSNQEFKDSILQQLQIELNKTNQTMFVKFEELNFVKTSNLATLQEIEKLTLELAEAKRDLIQKSGENKAIEAKICTLLSEIEQMERKKTQIEKARKDVELERDKFWQTSSPANVVLKQFNTEVEEMSGSLQSSMNHKIAQLKRMRCSIDPTKPKTNEATN